MKYSVTIEENLIDELGYEFESYEFNSIPKAYYFKGYKHHTDNYYITEWNYENKDEYGIPEIVAQCSMSLLSGNETELPI